MQPTLDALKDLARKAGGILRAGYEQDFRVEYKGAVDPVTEVDRRSEAYLLDEIRRRFPNTRILAEESGASGEGGDGLWYIDPLDGTVNFAHGVPIFAVSIAYASAQGVILAAVYDPMRDELFCAERGSGAWLNERRLAVSRVTELRRSLLVTGFPYDILHSPQNNLDHFARLSRISQGVRRLGSAALDLCYVAAGRFDGYWELKLHPWDLAAGGLIAAEAGARVTDMDGQPDYLLTRSILAAPPALHPQILNALHTPSSP